MDICIASAIKESDRGELTYPAFRAEWSALKSSCADEGLCIINILGIESAVVRASAVPKWGSDLLMPAGQTI